MADGLYELLIKAKADVADLPGLVSQLKTLVMAEASAKQATAEMAKTLLEAADATRRLEDIAARGTGIERMALDHRRLTAEIQALGKTQGNAALAQTAQANANRQFAAQLAEMNKATTGTRGNVADLGDAFAAAAPSAGHLEFAARNLRFQLADMFTQASAGTNPLLILAQQGPDIAYSFAGASKATDVLKAAFGGLIPSAATVTSSLSSMMAAGPYVALSAAAIATAYAIVGNVMADVKEATRAAGPSLDMLTSSADSSAAAASGMSKAWSTVDDAFRDAQTELDILNGKLTENIAKANEQIRTMRQGEQGKALLADGRAYVEAEAALTRAIQLQNRGDAEAGAQVGRLRQRYQDAKTTLEEHKAKLEETELLIWGVAAAKDADAAAGDRSKAATDRMTEAEKRAKAIREEWTKGMKTWADAQRYVEDLAADSPIEKETLRYQRLIATIQDAADAGADQATVLKAQKVAALEHADALKKIADEQRAATQSTIDGKAAEGVVPGAQRAATVVSAGSSPQGVMGVVSQAGPWGALIAAIVGALKEGIGNIGNSFEEYHEDVMDGLSNIFKDLGAHIYDWISDGTEALVSGVSKMLRSLIGNLATIVTEIVRAIIDNVFTMDFFFGIVKALILGLVDLFKSIFMPSDESKDKVVKSKANEFAWWDDLYSGKMTWKEFWSGDSKNDANWTPKAKGSHASGARYIAEDGMYQLHKFEVVKNRAQVNSEQAAAGGRMRARLSGQGGRLTLDIDTDSVSETLQELDRRGFQLRAGA